MTNLEKMYLLNECINQFMYVEKYHNIKPGYCLVSLGKAYMLKSLIEKYIDCQPKKYYDKYKTIVELYKKWK